MKYEDVFKSIPTDDEPLKVNQPEYEPEPIPLQLITKWFMEIEESLKPTKRKVVVKRWKRV